MLKKDLDEPCFAKHIKIILETFVLNFSNFHIEFDCSPCTPELKILKTYYATEDGRNVILHGMRTFINWGTSSRKNSTKQQNVGNRITDLGNYMLKRLRKVSPYIYLTT